MRFKGRKWGRASRPLPLQALRASGLPHPEGRDRVARPAGNQENGNARTAQFQLPQPFGRDGGERNGRYIAPAGDACRSEEHTSELQSLMRISYAVLCFKKNKNDNHTSPTRSTTTHCTSSTHM